MWAQLTDPMTILWTVVSALALVMFAVLILRILGRRAARRFSRLIPALEAQLKKTVPDKAWIRAERAIGDVTNSDEAKGTGGLALYPDELVFRRVDGAPWRLALTEITDMTEIRAASALDMQEDVIDAAPDYMVRFTYKGGNATFVVESATDWIAEIAKARP